MSVETDVAEILAKVRALYDVADRMGWFGPRVLDGDGSKPALPPDPHTPATTPGEPATSGLNPIVLAMLGGNGTQATGHEVGAGGGAQASNGEGAPDSPVFDFHLGSRRLWSGAAGAVHAFLVPVPQGWVGTIGIQVGESSAAGASVAQLDVWTDNATLCSKASLCSTEVSANAPFHIYIRQYQSGGGIAEIQPHQGG